MAKKILVVEDEPSLLSMFKSMLTDSGYVVDTAENGKIALEKIVTFKPDLMLLDILMPVMHGFEVLKNLKVDVAGKHLPVIVLTSLGQEKDEKLARVLGADEFLRKDNVHLEEVLDKIKKILGPEKK